VFSGLVLSLQISSVASFFFFDIQVGPLRVGCVWSLAWTARHIVQYRGDGVTAARPSTDPSFV
jgi:hypothetical protein